MTVFTDTLTESLVLTQSPYVGFGLARTEGVVLTDTYAYAVTPGGASLDTFSLTESLGLDFIRTSSLTETLRLAEKWAITQPVTLTESLSLSDAFTAWVNTILAHGIKLTDVLTPSFIMGFTITDALKLASAWDVHNTISVVEGVTLTETPAYVFVAGGQITELLTLTTNLSTQLVMRLAATDTLTFTDAELLNFIYSATVTENILIELLYQEPSGSVTSWAINTRTNAVTEYRNWAYNSFANIGRKYLGANETGLYELNGARDGTANVLADMMSGYFQPNGAKFAGLKGVYIGATGQGNYILKLQTGDGNERVYRAMLNPGLMTTKVNIGKGLRARYIAWELLNEDGQDFDLDTIEFVPMMSGRRV
jgi:hypothetical protein